jgi:citrate synthase
LTGKLSSLAGPQHGGATEGSVEGILHAAIGQIMNLIQTPSNQPPQHHQSFGSAPPPRYSPY